MLEVRNLYKKHQEISVLKGISFVLEKGEIGILLGKSGAGKSTLLRVLTSLEKMDQGECLIDGISLSEKKAYNIGMVFQQWHLFEHLNVEENILLALLHAKKKNKEEAGKIVRQLLAEYNLLDKKSVSVATLSGGQKQRLAIARAIALDPDVLFLDEPTSALDPKLSSTVAEYIIALAKQGKSILLTTHDIPFASQLPAKLFLIEEGQIIEEGSFEQLQADPSSYPFLWHFLQAG